MYIYYQFTLFLLGHRFGIFGNAVNPR